jgi:queuine tRNA-ribosyltransferase
MVASTLATIHNEFFTVQLVDKIRETMQSGEYEDFKNDFLARYYVKRQQ